MKGSERNICGTNMEVMQSLINIKECSRTNEVVNETGKKRNNARAREPQIQFRAMAEK